MEILINDKTYTVDISNGNLEISWFDDTTQLEKVAVMEEVKIGSPQSKSISTRMYVYDVTPSGMRINRKEVKYATSEEDFDFFEQSPIGSAVKLFVMNGMVRKLDIAWAIFNAQGEQVTVLEQPVVEEPIEGGE